MGAKKEREITEDQLLEYIQCIEFLRVNGWSYLAQSRYLEKSKSYIRNHTTAWEKGQTDFFVPQEVYVKITHLWHQVQQKKAPEPPLVKPSTRAKRAARTKKRNEGRETGVSAANGDQPQSAPARSEPAFTTPAEREEEDCEPELPRPKDGDLCSLLDFFEEVDAGLHKVERRVAQRAERDKKYNRHALNGLANDIQRLRVSWLGDFIRVR